VSILLILVGSRRRRRRRRMVNKSNKTINGIFLGEREREGGGEEILAMR